VIGSLPLSASSAQDGQGFNLTIEGPSTDVFDPYFGTVSGLVLPTAPGPGSWRLERSFDLGAGSGWMPAGEGTLSAHFGIYRLPEFTWPPVETAYGPAVDQRLVFIAIYQDHSSIATWQGATEESSTRFTPAELDLTNQGQIPQNHGKVEIPAAGAQPSFHLSAFVSPAMGTTAPAAGTLPPSEAFVRSALIANAAALRDSLFAPPPPSNSSDPGTGYDSYGQVPSGYYRLSPHRFPDVDHNGIPDYLQVFNHLIITEVCYDNRNGVGFTTPDYRHSYDWVEVYNPTSSPIPLEDIYLSDNPSVPLRYSLSGPNADLAPGESLVIYCMGADSTLPPFLSQAPFRLADAGEAVLLSDLSGNLIDSFPAPGHPDWIGFPTHPLEDISFGRTGVNGQPAFRFFTLPSPGRQSGDPGYAGVCAEPEIFNAAAVPPASDALPGGFLDAPVLAGVRDGIHRDHANGGAVILDPGTGLPLRDTGSHFVYTLNGAEPSADSNPYTGPITITRGTVLRVSALRPDCLPSASVTRTFIHPADVLSQTRLPGLLNTGERWHADPAVVSARFAPGTDTDGIAPPAFAAYDVEPGILAALRSVPSVAITLPWGEIDTMFFGSNSKIDYPASFEWIDPFQPSAYDQENCSVQISGEGSALSANKKKRFDIIFRKRLSRYGRPRWQGPATTNAPLESTVFPGSPVHTFDRLLLRNPYTESFGKNSPADFRYFSDSYLKETQRAVGGFNVRRRWVHAYLNGYYWGIYDLAEHVDPDFFRSHILAGSLPRADQNPNTTAYNDIHIINFGIDPPARDEEAADHFSNVLAAAGVAAANPDDAAKWSALTALVDIEDYVGFIITHATVGEVDFDFHEWRGWIHPDDNRMRFILWDGDNAWLYPNPVEKYMRFNSSVDINFATKLHQILHRWNDSEAAPVYETHPSYRTVFGNVLKSLTDPEGALSQSNLNARFDESALEVRSLLSCEAMRWGDSQSVDIWKSNLFGANGARVNVIGFPVSRATLLTIANAYSLTD
jgi:hypothetical protein